MRVKKAAHVFFSVTVPSAVAGEKYSRIPVCKLSASECLSLWEDTAILSLHQHSRGRAKFLENILKFPEEAWNFYFFFLNIKIYLLILGLIK